MSEAIPSYVDLYSISDLHLGGTGRAGQIFSQGARVKALAEKLAGLPGPLAFAIAGDLFDSLPHLTNTGAYIAVDGAAEIMQTIMADRSFAPVFDGLRTFLKAPNRELIILIGNHDLEIAFPETQEALLQQIAPTPDARGRVRFSTAGVGFRCRVGDRVVYITHGNEADPWNHVDHEALRRAAHARALGQKFDARKWVPNAGTKLVIDVMNSVKARYAFIDLLKPERRAAINVLSILAPKEMARLVDALPAFADAARAHIGPHVVLGADGRLVEAPPPAVQLLGNAARAAMQRHGASSTAPMKARVAEYERTRVRAVDLVSDDDSTLGRWQYYVDRLMGTEPAEALRQALVDWLDEDLTFSLQDRDDVCKGVLSQVGSGIDVVITGHTHLPRWIDAREQRLVYLNAGAWARVIGLRPAFLSEDAFGAVYSALTAATMDTLDKTSPLVDGRPVPLVLDACAVAHVKEEGNFTRVELLRVLLEGGSADFARVDPNESALEWQ
jgi:UDP-2,3-diacylglucosamine pyrophosphatase LpxH